MNVKKRCETCLGQKTTIALGCMRETCATCDGLGYIKDYMTVSIDVYPHETREELYEKLEDALPGEWFFDIGKEKEEVKKNHGTEELDAVLSPRISDRDLISGEILKPKRGRPKK